MIDKTTETSPLKHSLKDFVHIMYDNFGLLGWICFIAGHVKVYMNSKLQRIWFLMIFNVLLFAKFIHTGVYKEIVINRLWIQPTILFVVIGAVGLGFLLNLGFHICQFRVFRLWKALLKLCKVVVLFRATILETWKPEYCKTSWRCWVSRSFLALLFHCFCVDLFIYVALWS